MHWISMTLPAVAFAAALRLYPLLDGALGPLGTLLAGLLLSALVLALVAWLRLREGIEWDIVGHHPAGRNLRAFSPAGGGGGARLGTRARRAALPAVDGAVAAGGAVRCDGVAGRGDAVG